MAKDIKILKPYSIISSILKAYISNSITCLSQSTLRMLNLEAFNHIADNKYVYIFSLLHQQTLPIVTLANEFKISI